MSAEKGLTVEVPADDGERICHLAERRVTHGGHPWRWHGRYVVATYRCPGFTKPEAGS